MSDLESLKRSEVFDELYTPSYAVRPLLKYIPEGTIIWEPTDPGFSKITKVLRENDFEVITTHISTGFDFLGDPPSFPGFEFDMIITNPPWSKKDEFLQQCYNYEKPFAMLLPNSAISGVGRVKMYSQYGLEVMVINRRIDYTGKDNNWQWSSWFCHKLLPEKLMFHSFKKSEMKEPSVYSRKLMTFI